MSLSELRCKDVVNVPDGRVLGKVMDLEFCPQDGRVQATATAARPGKFRFMHQGRKKDLSMNKGETVRLDFPPLSH